MDTNRAPFTHSLRELDTLAQLARFASAVLAIQDLPKPLAELAERHGLAALLDGRLKFPGDLAA